MADQSLDVVLQLSYTSTPMCASMCKETTLYLAEYSFVQYKCKYSVILSVLDPRKYEYLKDCSLDFEHAYMATYLAS